MSALQIIIYLLVGSIIAAAVFSFWKFKTKSKVEEKISLYEREQRLEIDKGIQDRIKQNWNLVDEARRSSHDSRLKIEKEIADLQAKKTALQEYLKTATENLERERADFNKLLAVKDAEIKRLSDLTNKLIDTSNTILVTFSNKK